jgi:uncharacterized membrane protein
MTLFSIINHLIIIQQTILNFIEVSLKKQHLGYSGGISYLLMGKRSILNFTNDRESSGVKHVLLESQISSLTSFLRKKNKVPS